MAVRLFQAQFIVVPGNFCNITWKNILHLKWFLISVVSYHELLIRGYRNELDGPKLFTF